ncbi:MAG: hypothetical protein F7B19_06860 [Desulfurococcales archaeon]|nr:hypothetical protein [Desulfurococcales archaeon]MCE4626394.1 hypothetical protein [Desulfurococcales archaeon]
METIRGEGYEIIIDERFTITRWSPEERRLYTTKTLLEADVKISLVGERIAGLLLPPVSTSSEELEKLIKIYRKRIVAEQAVDFVSKLGPLAKYAEVDIAYFPVSRARLLWRDIGCLLNLDPEKLRQEYRVSASVAGEVVGEKVKIKPRKYREFLTTTLRKIQLATANWASGVVRFLRMSNQYTLTICNTTPEQPDPSHLVDLPEGNFVYECPSIQELARYHAGEDAKCKKGGWTASTYICEGSDGKIAVKEYLRMIVKWLPASIASYSAVNYLIRPKSRLYNEYKHLLELRRVIETPRILTVCGDSVRSVMVRSFIEGTPVIDSGDSELWWRAGFSLARIHNEGYVLGDPNPGNFIDTRDGMGLIDAEQARKFTPKAGAWDLIVYVYYPVLFGKDVDLIAEGLRGYLEGIDESLRKVIVRHLRSRKMWLGLSFLPVQYRRAREVFEAAGVRLT